MKINWFNGHENEDEGLEQVMSSKIGSVYFSQSDSNFVAGAWLLALVPGCHAWQVLQSKMCKRSWLDGVRLLGTSARSEYNKGIIPLLVSLHKLN